MAKLVLHRSGGEMRDIPLDQDRITIGRRADHDVCLPFPAVSADHAEIITVIADSFLHDLGSTNGTFVNWKRINEPYVLQPNDRLSAGQLTIIFDQPQAPVEETIVIEEDSMVSAEITMAGSLEGLLSEETEGKSTGHMAALIRAGRELAGHMPLDRLFELILKLSVEAVGATRGTLMTLEDGALKVRASLGAGFNISSHVREVVIAGKRSLLVRDTMMDQALAERMSIVQQQIRSMLAVPLQTEDRVIGLIYLDSRDLIREFTKEDLSLLTVMGNIAAIRIEHARLVEVEQAERLRAQEMEHAAMIQRSILPGCFPPFPDRHDFQLHAAMTPAREVGGDFFDFFLLDQDHLAFAIGDVSGKGVPAALFMAVARTLLRATAQHRATPGHCLTYLNMTLAEQNVSGMFVTVFYGVLDTRTGEIQFANGGHNPPYIFSKDGCVRLIKNENGPMLALIEGAEYQVATAHLAPGDAILLYTDGVTDARDRNGEFFNEWRLQAYLEEHAAEPADVLVSGLHRNLQEFAAGAQQADDITTLALRFAG
jgi:sigma-B regulation protein RsbU (phosphoserine phosphatase)